MSAGRLSPAARVPAAPRSGPESILRPVLRPAALVLAAGLALGACVPMTRMHGFVPGQGDVARITPGVDTVATVEEILGRPSASGLLSEGAWYYVQSTVQTVTWRAPQVVDRTVLAVSFDQQGLVTGVDRYGIEDGRVVNLSTRVTGTGGRQLGIIEQLFGNILNIDPAAVQAAGQ